MILTKERTKEVLNDVADELNKLCRLVRNVGLVVTGETEITEETKQEIAKTITPLGELFHDEKFQAITSAVLYLNPNTVKADFTTVAGNLLPTG